MPAGRTRSISGSGSRPCAAPPRSPSRCSRALPRVSRLHLQAYEIQQVLRQIVSAPLRLETLDSCLPRRLARLCRGVAGDVDDVFVAAEGALVAGSRGIRSEEHTSELQSQSN